MIKFENWTEITKGIYRYVIVANCCYEIHILYWHHDTDILTAKASLYLVGDWYERNSVSYFSRECLLAEQPVQECLMAAVLDDKENNNHD